MELWNIKNIKNLAQKYNFRYNHSLGQNFLIKKEVCQKIVEMSQISQNDGVIEIGPGMGILTKELCKKAKKVVAIEIDKRLIPVLNETLEAQNNIKIINADVLKINLCNLIVQEFNSQQVIICANLPYYITSQIIMNLLKMYREIKQITVMVQKEVAQRMEATPGTRNSGILSLVVRYYSEPQILFEVSKDWFNPRPDVDSAVISLKLRDKPLVTPISEELFFKVIKAAFSHRRKMAINSMGSELKIEKEKLKEIFDILDLDLTKRAENLTLKDYKNLSDKLYKSSLLKEGGRNK